MGSLNIAYPSAGGQSLEQQVAGLKSYLFALADQLNLADWSAGAVLRHRSGTGRVRPATSASWPVRASTM